MAVSEAKIDELVDEKSLSANAWFQLQVQPDGSRALVRKIVPHRGDGKPVTAADILKKLKENRVCHGVELARIEELIARAGAGQECENSVPVALSDVREGEDGEITWLVDESKGELIVAPDTQLALLRPGKRGVAGKNIFGKKKQARPVYEPRLSAGNGVRMEEQESGEFLFISNICGVLDLQKDVISVDGRVRVSTDHMSAYMDMPVGIIEPAGHVVSEQDVLAMLESLNVTEGILTGEIRTALASAEGPAEIVKKVLVAKGKEPRDGVNARLIMEESLAIGKLKENGEIDFHEKSYPWNVRKGDIVGTITPPRKEEHGYTVTGRVLEAEPALGIGMSLDGLVKEDDGQVRANRDGVLLISENAISVSDTLLIDGDVCHRTGNVHSSKPVIVKGYVEPGFSLQSDGDVVVQDNVEQSAVRANGDVVVKSGIRGSQSSVLCRADIRAGFVENARIKALGNIAVENSLVNCHSFCLGTLTVGSTSSPKSTLIGGYTHVVKGIVASNLGSEGCSKTVIRVGAMPEIERRYRETTEELKKRKKLLDELLLMHRQKRKLSNGADAQLDVIANTCRLIKKEFDQVKQENQQLLKQLRETRKARVVVQQQVFPGVTIQVLDYSFEVRKKENAGVFFLEDDLIIFRPSA